MRKKKGGFNLDWQILIMIEWSDKRFKLKQHDQLVEWLGSQTLTRFPPVSSRIDLFIWWRNASDSTFCFANIIKRLQVVFPSKS